MGSIFNIERVEDHKVFLKVEGSEGSIRYWVPECINVAYPGYEPDGISMAYGTAQMRRMNRVDVWTSLLKELGDKRHLNNPVLWTRGPETMLKMESEDELTTLKRLSDDELHVNIVKPGVFRYDSIMKVTAEKVTVDITLVNDSSWDWHDAYVYFCCGLDTLPEFTDHIGQRTMLFTTDGPKHVSQLHKHTWTDFRTTAQHYEPEGKRLPRTENGFLLDECGVSSNRVINGIVLRQSRNGKRVLVAMASKFRGIFMDMGESNNCIHANPSAGFVAAGETVNLQGALLMIEGTLEEVAKKLMKK